MDAEFREIFELSCEKGFRAIIDEAEWHLAEDADAHTAFVDKLAGLSNHFERAMVTFLDHNHSGRGRRVSITRILALLAQAQEPAAPVPRRWMTPASRACRPDPATISITPKGGVITAWWRRSSVANETTSLPTRKTTRSKASNGWTESSIAARTIRPSR